MFRGVGDRASRDQLVKDQLASWRNCSWPTLAFRKCPPGLFGFEFSDHLRSRPVHIPSTEGRDSGMRLVHVSGVATGEGSRTDATTGAVSPAAAAAAAAGGAGTRTDADASDPSAASAG